MVGTPERREHLHANVFPRVGALVRSRREDVNLLRHELARALRPFAPPDAERRLEALERGVVDNDFLAQVALALHIHADEIAHAMDQDDDDRASGAWGNA